MSSWPRFQTRVPGKWVLTGEHSVLRGATAVALPHPEFSLSIAFEPDSSARGVEVIPAVAQSVVQEMIEAVSEQWSSERERSFPSPRGTMRLESTIPVGAGLGSSASLCVALARWMSEPLALPRDSLFEFSKQLEHRFHGKSSGMDVAVVSEAQAVSYSMEKGPRALGIRRLPRFTFHDTGLRSRTSECVLRVERFREDTPTLAMGVDESMSLAGRTAMEGLFRFDQKDGPAGEALVALAMNRAHECFLSWGLVPVEAVRLIAELRGRGALAAKLTGAGGGGFVVALWPEALSV